MTLLTFFFSLLALPSVGRPPGIPVEKPSSPTIVMGFVGGFISHDNAVHSTVQLGAKLRHDFPTGVHVEVFENHRGDAAHREILSLLDADHDGKLSGEEKRNARIILYGHSWGASQVVNLAEELQREEIPVALTVQVDSVAKPGQNDGVIPDNVAQAVNFYQSDGLLHGRAEIRAADPARTEIIGNYKSVYQTNPISCTGYPWYARLLMRAHVEIECDSRVWSHVEALISGSVEATIRNDKKS